MLIGNAHRCFNDMVNSGALLICIYIYIWSPVLKTLDLFMVSGTSHFNVPMVGNYHTNNHDTELNMMAH